MKKCKALLLIIFLTFFACQNLKKEESNSVQNTMTNKMQELITILTTDSEQHQYVRTKLTDLEINEVENKLQLTLPDSYKFFLTNYANGAHGIYMNPIDDITNFSYLKKYRKELPDKIELVGIKQIETKSLLCLMTEDSNGGAWVWLTSEATENGEWPLAYYSMSDKKLHYQVNTFTEWLKLLTKGKYEVIRELDLEDKLELG